MDSLYGYWKIHHSMNRKEFIQVGIGAVMGAIVGETLGKLVAEQRGIESIQILPLDKYMIPDINMPDSYLDGAKLYYMDDPGYMYDGKPTILLSRNPITNTDEKN